MSSEHFDVWLFAVDLVNYVFLKCSKLHPDAAVNRFPGFACKSFTDILKTAVQLIKESVTQEVNEEFATFQQQYSLRPDAYHKYTQELRKRRFQKGSDVESFLHYSVHTAFLAHCFYSGGDRRAQVSAVFIISGGYQDGSACKFGMWEALRRVAEKIVFGTVAIVDKKQPRPQLVPQLVSSDGESFSSPEVENGEKLSACISKKAVTGSSGRDGLVKTVRGDLLDCKDLSKFDAGEVSCSTLRRVNRRIKDHAMKIILKPMPSLEESLESSLEELYISKASQHTKLVNGDGSLNSTAELEFSWKLGTINKNSPKRSSIDRRIFRLSPISTRDVRQFSPKSNTSFS